jgi:hypothetical protein
MTMKSFCFRVNNGTYRLNFGIENDALRSRGLLLVKPDRFPKVEITYFNLHFAFLEPPTISGAYLRVKPPTSG